ncbi:hypothetical protein [Flagellimonas onchidii]|uniref:hypothetical protein n=1 Tax=Flagellimonas onchidii TaxID=2562684 RepID=UPI0010A5F1E9|nr:hypothetical protein [Allomuricauda onchidii]
MITSDVFKTLTTFLDSETGNTLKLTFTQLKVDTYRNGHYFNTMIRPNSRLVLHKFKNERFAKIRVVDNLVFPFWFWFERPTQNLEYHTKMLRLSRPLAEGTLAIHAHKLCLQFTIDAPKKDLQLMVRQTYADVVCLDY